jgi:hypothetical protein
MLEEVGGIGQAFFAKRRLKDNPATIMFEPLQKGGRRRGRIQRFVAGGTFYLKPEVKQASAPNKSTPNPASSKHLSDKPAQTRTKHT